jgi:predicted RNA-binding Zn-ribbon protein involved in translation (DUF1610 family)
MAKRDQRKAECPACHHVLEKIPGSKTKCPHCGNFMYVRTRPHDRTRNIVTKTEADRIAADWLTYGEEQEDKKIVTIQEELDRIGHHNLKAWRETGVVKTFKCYNAPNGEVCTECRKHDGAIVNIDEAKIGENLSPFSACLNANRKQCGRRGCRCYWLPWNVSLN